MLGDWKWNFKSEEFWKFEGEKNANGNQAVLLENRWQDRFVSNNVVNLSKRNLNDVDISLLSKGLKMELEVFGKMLCLKWHFRDENKDIHRDKFNPKSKVNLCNKGGAIELYLSSLEKKLMTVEGPKGKFSKLTNSECKALYDLKMIKKYWDLKCW